MKGNKTWMIIAAIALVAGAGYFFYIKKRKASAETPGKETAKSESPSGGGGAASLTAPASKVTAAVTDKTPITEVNPMLQVPTVTKAATPAAPIPNLKEIVVHATPVAPVVKPTVIQSIPVPAPAPTPVIIPSMPAGVAKMLRVVEDGSKHKAIARVTPKKLFKVGDSVKVNGSIYKGTFKVWYIYTAHATEDAVYLDTPFKGTDVGTITK